MLGWTWNDFKDLTWKEFNWAWEAKFEFEADSLALLRHELAIVNMTVNNAAGGHAPWPRLQDYNPLKVE